MTDIIDSINSPGFSAFLSDLIGVTFIPSDVDVELLWGDMPELLVSATAKIGDKNAVINISFDQFLIISLFVRLKDHSLFYALREFS